MADESWTAASFAGAAAAQADVVAALSPTERIRLLEQLIELATASSALQRSRADKQRAIGALWGSSPDPAAPT